MRTFFILLIILCFLGCNSDVNDSGDDMSLPASSDTDKDTDTTTESVKFIAG